MSNQALQGTRRDAEDVFADTTIVDVDVHINLLYDQYGDATYGIEDLTEYMTEPYASYVRSPDGSYPSSGWSKTLGGKRELIVGDASSPEGIRQELMEGLGVDVPIINRYARLDMVMRTARALEEMRATNDFLLEKFLDGNDDFYGLASVAARAPDKAAEEIDRIGGEDQFVGVFLQAGSEFQKPLGDPSLDVMYQAMADNDLTPVYHADPFDQKAPCLREFQTAFARIGAIWGGMFTMTSLIENGVFEKFPDLNFVFDEFGGLSWAALMMGKSNREYGQWTSELPLLTKSPEEYIRDQCYFATQPLEEFNDPEHMMKIIEIVGPENICYSSDFPHHDFDNPVALDGFLQRLGPEEREQVLSGNAIEAFGLEL